MQLESRAGLYWRRGRGGERRAEGHWAVASEPGLDYYGQGTPQWYSGFSYPFLGELPPPPAEA